MRVQSYTVGVRVSKCLELAVVGLELVGLIGLAIGLWLYDTVAGFAIAVPRYSGREL